MQIKYAEACSSTAQACGQSSENSQRLSIQWGSEIQPFEIWKHLKSKLFEGRISNGWALAMAKAIVPTVRKLDYSKCRHFCPDFKWVFYKMTANCLDF